jgi:hypothetical protein
MSAIRSALDEMGAVDRRSLSADELAADLVELDHVVQKAEVLQAETIKALADCGGHHELGYRPQRRCWWIRPRCRPHMRDG